MHPLDTQPLTEKGRQTRQRILDTATQLFCEDGYEHTTLRDIAVAADCSPGLVYHYFASKEQIAQALYLQLGELLTTLQLPTSRLDERYYALMLKRLDQFSENRESVAALFSAAMKPNSAVAFTGDEEWYDPMCKIMMQVTVKSIDAPQGKQAEHMADLLYAMYLLLTLFWLYDRTPQQRASHNLLKLIRELLRIVRPMLLMPMFNTAIAKLSEIVQDVFGNSLHTASQNGQQSEFN